MLKKAILITLMVHLAPNMVYANELTKLYESACEKIKICAFQSMSDEEKSESMMEIAEEILDSVCLSLPGARDNLGQDKEKIIKARSCLDSIANSSCEQINVEDGIPACAEYDEYEAENNI